MIPSHRRLARGVLLLMLGALSCSKESPTTVTSTQQPGAAVKLTFKVQPASAAAGTPISPAIVIAVTDAAGNTVTTSDSTISLSIGSNPSGAALAGTLSVKPVAGVATFSDIALFRGGTGYSLLASANGLLGAVSGLFNVTAGSSAAISFASIAAGLNTMCGIGTNGSAYCWGDNSAGQGGFGAQNHTAAYAPQLVATTQSFSVLSTVQSVSCGVTPAHALYCWGDNGYGELGTGTLVSSGVPVPVTGGLQWSSVAAGGTGACGLTTANIAYCWGTGANGQLGNGTNPTRDSVPTLVSGGHTFAALSGGIGGGFCGVTLVGEAYCWGAGAPGSASVSGASLVPSLVDGGLTWSSVATASNFACGLTTAGAAYCWGFNNNGQLGNGTTTNSKSPAPVSGGLTFKAISVGGFACAVTTAGAAYCWGSANSLGQLGTGSTAGSSVPVAVSGALTFTSIAVGNFFACGLTTDKAVYCWGGNTSGQFGNGTTANSNVPTKLGTGN